MVEKFKSLYIAGAMFTFMEPGLLLWKTIFSLSKWYTLS